MATQAADTNDIISFAVKSCPKTASTSKVCTQRRKVELENVHYMKNEISEVVHYDWRMRSDPSPRVTLPPI